MTDHLIKCREMLFLSEIIEQEASQNPKKREEGGEGRRGHREGRRGQERKEEGRRGQERVGEDRRGMERTGEAIPIGSHSVNDVPHRYQHSSLSAFLLFSAARRGRFKKTLLPDTITIIVTTTIISIIIIITSSSSLSSTWT